MKNLTWLMLLLGILSLSSGSSKSVGAKRDYRAKRPECHVCFR